MIKKEVYRHIFKIIKKYDNIVLARHISPDPDAIASQIALRESIKETFPKKNVYAIGASVNKFKYLGNLDRVDVTEIKDALLIVLDVPNFYRVDGIEGLDYKEILKIDHHPAEDIIGAVDYTDPIKSSTCEMIAEIIMNTPLILTKTVAENLYIGILADSERFLLQNTTVETLKTTTRLLEESRIDFVALHDALYERSISEDKLRAYLINNIKISDNKFGFIYVTNETLKEYGVEATTVSSQVNNFYHLKELLCWMFVVYDERNDIYKANIRSCGPVINEIASEFGGGGHKYASGCRTNDYKRILKLAESLDKACEDYIKEQEK